MGNVQMVGKSSAPMYRGEKPDRDRLAPLFALEEVAEHAVDFWLSAEDLPDPDNRVTLGNHGDVVLTYTPNNRQPLEELYSRVKQQPRAPRHAPAPPGAARPVHEERHPGRRLRAPGRHGPVR